MIYKHDNYLSYTLPIGWISENTEDNLILYNPNGNGAITISFYNILEMENSIDEYISIMAKKFIEQNKITINIPFVLKSKDGVTKLLYGEGKTADEEYLKLWIIARYPKVIFATYLSESKTLEVQDCDEIINSFQINY